MLDQQSPVAPARVRVLLLPIGQVKRARFSSFLERLVPENVVQLGDVSPDGRPNRNMFSPLAFPAGMILYDLTTFYPPVSHLSLSPFESYREPLVILAVADGVELDHISYRGEARRSLNGNGPPLREHNLRELYQGLEDLRDRYPKALVHQVLLFDYVHKTPTTPLPEGLVAVPPVAESKRTTIKTIMCDISSLLLAEMTTLAKSLQALNTIESPSQSQLSRQANGAAWPMEELNDHSRRNSQYSLPLDSRSNSPGANGSRSHVRMSMPVQLSRANSTSSNVGRPGTPLNGLQSSAAVTSGDNLSSGNGDLVMNQKSIPTRFASPDIGRDSSRDRVSVQGFGSGSVSERSRNKGKGRIGIVIGSLYLAAGRWSDALRELSDGVSIAKNNLDHLWHAKALDLILVGMLMFTWAGLDFQIPPVCYVSHSDKTSSVSSTSEKSANLRADLIAILPELVDRILNLYTRAANNTGEPLPQLPFSETVIRFSRLLSAIHLGGGVLDSDVLQFIVLGTPLQKAERLSISRLQIQPTRTEIATTIFRAFPRSSSPEILSVADRVLILSEIASILGVVGYHRKKAMVTRELLSVLVPGLVQARIKGAADMGVHPAAGLAALNLANGNSTGAGVLDLGGGDVETGVEAFLGSLCQTYGIVSSSPGQGSTFEDSDEVVASRILHDAAVRSFGGHDLKMDILRSCINLCEALPNFHGVLKFTADLLRTAGSGVAPGPRSDNAAPFMSREEQVRLATNVARTITAANNLGVKELAAEYWDEFLVRGVDVEPLPPTRLVIPHNSTELPGSTSVVASREGNPFIYSHFSRTPDTATAARLLIAGEGAVFKVTLQNPYEFDVELESIKLETEGAVFESSTQKTVIGPYRTQILNVPGMPKACGELKITGCIIRVRGCRERRFPIYAEPWSPQREAKVKVIGRAPVVEDRSRPLSRDSAVTSTSPSGAPKATALKLNVIDRQPVVVVRSTTLAQSALMVLEGERQIFSITLRNLSSSTPVDLLLFSFKDSTQSPLEIALSNRDASPSELYEYELIYAKKQAFRWLKKAKEKPYIEPGGVATFDIEILGKPGLTSAVVQVDYGQLGVSRPNVPETFYTRQVSVPLTITVNASIELSRMDVLPLSKKIPRSLWTPPGIHSSNTEENLPPAEHCLLILDFRNAWPSPLHVDLDITNSQTISEEILPGNTSRIISIIPRIYLPNPWNAIPALDPSRQRQFVVSTGKISADVERATREAFWYREEILKKLKGRWSTKTGSKREGDIELRGMKLNPRIIDALRIDDLDISLSIIGAEKLNGARYEIFTDSFSELKIHITNRTPKAIHPLLRLQPSLRNQPNMIPLDLSKRLVWNGTLQQTLPLLPGHESKEFSIGITPLCRGEFEISASVEETRSVDDDDGSPGGSGQKEEGRPRANTRTMMDAILGAKERRIWHCREACMVVVKDEVGSEEEDGEGE